MGLTMAEAGTPRRIAVGVTGASGALYAARTIAALLEAGCELEVVFSDYGKRLLLEELGPDARVERLLDVLEARYGGLVGRGSFVVHSNKDMGATLASGSHRCEAMVIVPCSMKTLAGVVAVAALLAWEQSLVRADDLSQVKRAFDMNGWVGLLYFAATAAAVYWR